MQRDITSREVGALVALRPGMGIDLGGVAKGYAVDRAIAALRRSGIRHALVTTGSTTAVIGGKRNGSAWKIGIENPRSPGDTIGVVSLKGGAVSTSGDYQNYFEHDGVRYHHILSPENGMPARDSISATVIMPGQHASNSAMPGPGMITDIFSTAWFVEPSNVVTSLRESGEQSSPVAVFVTSNRRVRTVGNLKGIVSDLPARI